MWAGVVRDTLRSVVVRGWFRGGIGPRTRTRILSFSIIPARAT